MAYTTYDFAECLARVELPARPIRVTQSWSRGDSGSDWEGGFIVHLANNQYAYIEGYCDYTGWG